MKALRLQLLHTSDGSPSLSVNATGNISPKRPRRLGCFASTVNKMVACFSFFKRKAEATAILQSHLAARRGRIFSACFSVNCLVHMLMNYTENVVDPFTCMRKQWISLAIENVYKTSLVQQCRMLESELKTDVVAKCLHDPENATSTVQSSKKVILRRDYDKLLSESLSYHP